VTSEPLDQPKPPGDPVQLLERALDQAGRLIRGVRDDQRGWPTPCRSWDVGALLDHLVNDLIQFTARATGGTPDWKTPAPAHDSGWAHAFATGSAGLLAAWRAAGDLGGTLEIPGMGTVSARFPVDQQVTELAVHAWDLNRATGQALALDPAIATAALHWAQGAMPEQARGTEAEGKAFGPAVPIDERAPIYDRLAAFFGRNSA
jgi:uncharacterized protein (TIGR03086 family)